MGRNDALLLTSDKVGAKGDEMISDVRNERRSSFKILLSTLRAALSSHQVYSSSCMSVLYPRSPRYQRSPRSPCYQRSPRSPRYQRSPRSPRYQRSPSPLLTYLFICSYIYLFIYYLFIFYFFIPYLFTYLLIHMFILQFICLSPSLTWTS